MENVEWFLAVYGVLALSHILIQMLFAHREHKKQGTETFANDYNGHKPSVSVIVPCYNEDPVWLDKCLKSIAMQRYADIETIVIDDGSKNFHDLYSVYEKYRGHKGFRIILMERNVGKRHAQKSGFDLARGEIIVTIDSDTVIDRDGVKHIVKQFRNQRVGAVTGDVRAANKRENFLTQLIWYRYWTAFHQERAAQSLFDILMCCSGPFSAYRKLAIDEVKDRYVQQEFLGRPCTYGDDRHLTNLILEEGHWVRFDNRAVSYTHVPNTIRQYIRQQIRWNKSFYREMLWTLRHVHKHHWYMFYELSMQFLLPFLLVVALGFTVWQAIAVDVAHLWKYVIVLVSIAVLRSGYGIYRTGDLGFLRFIAYGFMHVFLLIPVRFYALATLRDTKWGTR